MCDLIRVVFLSGWCLAVPVTDTVGLKCVILLLLAEAAGVNCIILWTSKWRITKSGLYFGFFHSKIGLWKDLERLCFAWSSECISAVSGLGRASVHDWLYTSKYVHTVCDNVFPKDFWAHSTGANVHSGGRTEFKWSSFTIIKCILPLREESRRVHSLSKVLLFIWFKEKKLAKNEYL